MLIGRQIRGDEHLNIHEPNQELWVNAEMVLVVTTCSIRKGESCLRRYKEMLPDLVGWPDLLGHQLGSHNLVSFFICHSCCAVVHLFCFHRQKGGKEENAKPRKHPPLARVSCLLCAVLSIPTFL